MRDIKLLLGQLERLAFVLDELMPQTAEVVRNAITILKEQEKEIKNLKEIIQNADDALESIKEKLNSLLYEDFRRV